MNLDDSSKTLREIKMQPITYILGIIITEKTLKVFSCI